ncbi:hypothetical protein [Nonomuraea sp. SBT364]|uniref:hypothetical protein n=1 Tax=Nonomuraea sp. SBT364 TaxID=1580530 RepID=UPI00066E85A3|nr:hypothetical protein [Nonomuraea sp. SBT364]
MASYDDTLPLQPRIRLPSDGELAAAVPGAPGGGDPGEVLRAWALTCRDLLGGEEGLLLDLVRRFLAREPAGEPPAALARLGLVRGSAPYELTPLGLWTGRQLIAEVTGQEVPVMGSLAGRDAAALLHGLRSYPEPEREEELAGWLKGRDRAAAAAELAAVAGEVSPLARAVGIELLATRFGEDGRRALETLLAEPRTGAVVAARLGREDRRPDSGELAWVLVDMAAALLEFGGEADEVVESVALGLDPEEQAGTVALLALADHPGAEAVLRVFIDHHPDGRVSAAARKALRRLHGLAERR